MQVSDLHVYVKCHSFSEVFIHFASANQLTGFAIIEKLAANGLNNKLPEFRLNSFLLSSISYIKKRYSWCYNKHRRCFDKRLCWKVQQIYKRTPMLKCNFNIKLQWNFIEISNQRLRSVAAKFVAFFQKTFL